MPKYSSVLADEIAIEIRAGVAKAKADKVLIEASDPLEALHKAFQMSPIYDSWWEASIWDPFVKGVPEDEPKDK